MKIYLLDINKKMTNAWNKYFVKSNAKDEIEIINEEFSIFMNNHPEIEAIVSPANAFGLMDGGYDKAITKYFGKALMEDVQQVIIEDWSGEQPVGTSISVPIRNRFVENQKGERKNVILIHTPSMRTPERIKDRRIVYQCMRTTLIEAKKQEVDSIVIPAFGGFYGKVPPRVVAKMMYLAYNQINNNPTKICWRYADKIAFCLWLVK